MSNYLLTEEQMKQVEGIKAKLPYTFVVVLNDWALHSRDSAKAHNMHGTDFPCGQISGMLTAMFFTGKISKDEQRLLWDYYSNKALAIQ